MSTFLNGILEGALWVGGILIAIMLMIMIALCFVVSVGWSILVGIWLVFVRHAGLISIAGAIVFIAILLKDKLP